MQNNYEYIVNAIKNKKIKKNVTISIDEDIIDILDQIQLKIGITKNQILADQLTAFANDYYRINNPNYYIINSNNKNMPRGHFLMMANNKVSAWGNEKEALVEIEVGDYIFLYLDTFGIVGAGRATSKYINFPFSHYECYLDKEKTEINDIEREEEYFILMDYDKISFGDFSDEGFAGMPVLLDMGSVVTVEEIYDIIKNTELPNKELDLSQVKIKLSKEDGEQLKKFYLELEGGEFLHEYPLKKDNNLDTSKIEENQSQEMVFEKVCNLEKDLKSGTYVKVNLIKLFNQKTFSEDIIEQFSDKEYSKRMINVNYPLLKKIDIDKPIKEQATISDRPRYWVKPVVDINGEKYLLCSQWYDWNIENFKDWYQKIICE